MADHHLAWALPNLRVQLGAPFITTTTQTTMQVGTGQGAAFTRLPLVAKITDTDDLTTAHRDEDVLITARAADLLTIQRDVYGHGPQLFTTGGTVWVLNAAETINRLVTASYAAAGTIDVSQLATGGSGTRADPWTGWSAALAARYPTTNVESDPTAGLHFYFPPGYYAQDTTIQMGIGWVLRGAGPLASRIIANLSGTFTQVKFFNEPGNPGAEPKSAAINQRGGISGLYLENHATTGANVEVTNEVYVRLDHVSLIGSQYGLIWDMAEHCSLQDFDLGGHTVAGIWLVCGTEHYANSSVQMYTNNNYVSRGNINETAGAVGIAHDGGEINVVRDVGFNVSNGAIHLTAASAPLLESCYIEGGGAPMVLISKTSHGGVPKSFNNEMVAIQHCWINNGAPGLAAIDISSNGAGTHSLLTQGNILQASGVACIKGVANLVQSSFQNDVLHGGTGLYDVPPSRGLVFSDPNGAGTSGGLGLNATNFGGGRGVLAIATSPAAPTAGPATGCLLWYFGDHLLIWRNGHATSENLF